MTIVCEELMKGMLVATDVYAFPAEIVVGALGTDVTDTDNRIHFAFRTFKTEVDFRFLLGNLVPQLVLEAFKSFMVICVDYKQ